MELSLEEIIKMKKIGKLSNVQKKRLPNNINKKTSGVGGRLNGRINKSPRQPPQGRGNIKPGGKPVDARMKIIQKNRLRLTDARDKLAEIAKQTDARTKIKGRKMNNQNGRQDTRGRIGFRPNQNISAQQAPVLLQRSIKNNVAANLRDPSSMIRCTINRTASDFARSYGQDMDIDEPLPIRSHNDLSGIQVALKNEYTPYARQEYIPSREPYMDTYEPPMYRAMDSSRVRTADNMAAELAVKYEWPAMLAIRAARTSSSVEYSELSAMVPRPAVLAIRSQRVNFLEIGRSLQRSTEPRRMSLEMRARLDTPARLHRPPSPSPPPAQPQGHRIVVSNLHTSVTHEDIKELFEDIGPLITSRLVRAGTAEVIYKFQKDAKKAVDAYHNRQLDGQPMKCLLVNSRPTSSSSSGVLRSNNMPAAPKFPSSSKSMVVPDLSAIHKALFTSK